MNEMLTGALREAKTKEDVEYLFNKFYITKLEEKVKYLDRAMGADEVFYCGTRYDEDEYNITLAMFLAREWEIYKLYERLGF